MSEQMANMDAQGQSVRAEAWRRIRKSRLNRFCIVIIVLYTLVALYGEYVFYANQFRDTTPAYKNATLEDKYLPPSPFRPLAQNAAGADSGATLRRYVEHLAWHPLGTDGLGRDVWQRLVQGARIAYRVGIVTSLIAIPIGLILGCLAGYFGGRTDDFIVWLYSTFASIPGLLFVLAIAMVVGRGLLGVYLGIGLTTWVGLCRLIRGEVIKHKSQTYVQSARVLGLGHARILFLHILPNVFHIVIVTFTIRFPAAVGTEVILSFLGIGVRGEPSWGVMISNARLQLWQGVWWEMTFVTLAIFFLVLAFNILGDGLRDALDPRLKGQE